jgi:transposase
MFAMTLATKEDRMGIHKNAPLTPVGREILVRRVVDEGLTPVAVAATMGVSVRTVRKWVGRFEAHGPVRLITIDRADKMNSLDFEANDALTERWREFAADDGARVAVITGAGLLYVRICPRQ